jgi:transcriptional regulator of aromatic amino acid metabolism
MTVNDFVVTHEMQIRALKLFLKNDRRHLMTMETFLEDVGVPVYTAFVQGQKLVSNRAADRLLQRAKNEGIIKFHAGRWIDNYAAAAFLQGTTP